MNKDLLELCLEAIALKVKEGEKEQWTDGTFIRLSEAIEEETGILISRNTLKRLYGKMKTPDDYKPQRETKNALAIFAGYQSWEHLKKQHLEESIATFDFNKGLESTNKLSQVKITVNSRLQKFHGKAYIIAFILFALISAWFVIWKFNGERNKVEPTAEIKILNPADTVPYTLKISYTTKNVSPDSLFISDQPIYLLTNHFNFSIQTPIYTWINMKYKGKLLAKQPYLAISKGWVAYHQLKSKKAKFNYIDAKYWKKEGLARISKKWFEGRTQDSISFNWFLKNFKNFPLVADHFATEFKVRLENNGLGCSGILFAAFAEKGHLEACINPKSCANHNFLYLSEKIVEGEYYDFPNLDLKPNTWAIVRIEVVKKMVKILVDGKLTYKGEYKNELGTIKGFNIKFQGFGAMAYFKAWDENNKLIEDTQF